MIRQVDVITLRSDLVTVYGPQGHIAVAAVFNNSSGADRVALENKYIPIQHLVKCWYDLESKYPFELHKEERYIAVDYSQVEWLEEAINEDRRLLSEQIKRLKIDNDFHNTKHWRNIERASFLKRLKYLFTGEFDLESEK